MAGSAGAPSDCEPSKVRLKLALSPRMIVSRSSDAVSCAAKPADPPLASTIPSKTAAPGENLLRARVRQIIPHNNLSILSDKCYWPRLLAQASVRGRPRQTNYGQAGREFVRSKSRLRTGRLGAKLQPMTGSMSAPISEFLATPENAPLGPGPRPGVLAESDLASK